MNDPGDRRLEVVLEQIEQLNREVNAIGRRLERLEALEVIVAELHTLNQSLQAIALAALGRRGPDVTRRNR